MSKVATTLPTSGSVEIELKDPVLAAFLGWLIPGAGHLYQGRTAKGILFMVCILSTFFDGLYMSQSHAVYASTRPWDTRLPYLAQIGVGLPALPALVQTYRVSHDKVPLWNGFMAPPTQPEELADWNKQLNRYFELGTVYTMIAGLLNILAIFDAWGGPVPHSEESTNKEKEADDKKSRDAPST